MNRERAERLLGEIRGRVQNLAGQNAADPREGFRATNESGTTTLYIYDRIGGWWEGVFAKDVAAALRGAGDVTVHINSGGGDIFEGAAIHNLLKNHAGTVTMRIDGIAASAASFIAMAGDKIVMEPNATMMVHEGSAVCVGGAQDMREAADLLELLNKTIAGMYAARAGGTVDEWLATMGEETWYDAEKALAAGLVDEVPAAKGQESAELSSNAALDISVFDLLAKPVAAEAPAPVVAPTTTPDTAPAPSAETAPAAEPAPDTAPAPVVAESETTETTEEAPTVDHDAGFAALLRKELVK